MFRGEAGVPEGVVPLARAGSVASRAKRLQATSSASSSRSCESSSALDICLSCASPWRCGASSQPRTYRGDGLAWLLAVEEAASPHRMDVRDLAASVEQLRRSLNSEREARLALEREVREVSTGEWKPSRLQADRGVSSLHAPAPGVRVVLNQ